VKLSRLSIQVLTDAEKETVVNAALQVLERTGVKVCCGEARDLLKNAGCTVDEDLVKIPADLVRKAIKTAPDCIEIYDREGNPAMELTGTNSYYGPGVTCPYFYDPYTLERVPAQKQHVVETAIVADALENVNFLMSLCMISDETASLADIHEVEAMIVNSPKPLLCWNSFAPEKSAGTRSCMRFKPHPLLTWASHKWIPTGLSGKISLKLSSARGRRPHKSPKSPTKSSSANRAF
jgi:trimethylamine:corrinoid methyltransferase-like protein